MQVSTNRPILVSIDYIFIMSSSDLNAILVMIITVRHDGNAISLLLSLLLSLGDGKVCFIIREVAVGEW